MKIKTDNGQEIELEDPKLPPGHYITDAVLVFQTKDLDNDDDLFGEVSTKHTSWPTKVGLITAAQHTLLNPPPEEDE